MLIATAETSIKTQLYFDFAQTDSSAKKPHKKPKNADKRISFKPVAPATPVPDEGFRELCVLLHTLARKHVTASNFHDFNLVARCTKLLQALDVAIAAPAEMQAKVADQEAALVITAPEYRMLRSRALAGLATIADLADRMPAKGSAEYQRGMRDAYQHASDIAIMFLDDLEQFQSRTKKPW